MPDEFSRSTHSNRPRRRRGSTAPSWWSRLERTDLPDEAMGRPDPAASGEDGLQQRPSGSLFRLRQRSWCVYLVLAAASAFIILIGVGASSTHMALAALLVVGAPLGLAGLAASVVARRSGP